MIDAFGAGRPTSPQYWGTLVLGLLLALVVGCSQDRALAVQEMNKGIEAFNSGRSMTAVQHLKEAQRLDPSFAEPSLYLGQLYHRKLDELDNAEQAYREAMQREPDNADINYKLGTVLADKDEHQMAADQFRQTLDKEPEHARAWFRLGISQQALGEYPEAVESFMKSIRANPRMKMDDEDPGGVAYHALGDLYNRYGFFDKALAVYDNGITNNEGVARLYAGRGVAQLKLERHQEAADSFEQALELDPQHVPATFNLAVTRHQQGEQDEAIAVLERYLSRASDQARRNAAQGLLQKLRTTKADAAD